MKHLILAVLIVTISLPVTAGKPTKEQCSLTIDQAGIKRQATEAQKKECEARIAVTDPGVPSDKKPPKK